MERSTIIAGLASGMLVLVAGAGAVAAVGSLQDASQESLAIGQAQPQASGRRNNRAADAGSASGRQGGQNEGRRGSGWISHAEFVGLRVKFGLVVG